MYKNTALTPPFAIPLTYYYISYRQIIRNHLYMLGLALWSATKGEYSCNQLEALIADYQKNHHKKNLIVDLLECVEGPGLRLSIMIAGFIKNREQREDFINDLFIRASDKLKTVNIQSNIKGYVFRMVKFECINFLRSKGHNPPPTELLTDIQEFDIKTGYKSQEPDITQSDLSKWLEKIKQDLNEQEWEAIDKIYNEGKSHKDAAEEMKLDRNQFRGRLSRAVQKLRNRHGDDFRKYFND